MDRRLSLSACAVALALCACINEADYPSLDVRSIEKLPVVDEPGGQPAAPDDASLPPDVQAALGAAESGDARFRADLALATRAVAAARGTPPDGEAWVVAQQAISRAQASRVPAADARDAIDAALTSSQLPASPALAAAIDRVAAIDAEQGAALDALVGSLPAR